MSAEAIDTLEIFYFGDINAMKIMTKSILSSILGLGFLVAAGSSFAGSACYWMENTSGNPWVPAPQGNISKQQCYDLDSCDGGKGQSGGGCYKWATSADAQREPWFSCYWMKNTAGNPWVPAPQGNISKQECYDLDSCNGGKGQSGGGCYKWALDANAQRQPWN